MLATLVIVFRIEVLEAGLIVGIVLSATRGMARRGLWVFYGVAGGAAGACVVAAFAGEIAGLFAGVGQELFTASILIVAVTHVELAQRLDGRSRPRDGARDPSGRRGRDRGGNDLPTALAVVCGVAVLREGSEVVLFLYGIAASGSTSAGDDDGGRRARSVGAGDRFGGDVSWLVDDPGAASVLRSRQP